MRRPWRLAALTLGIPGLAAVALLASALQREPALVMQQEPAHEDIARAIELVRANDPRRAMAGAVNAVEVNERDLDILLNHGAHRWLDATTRVGLERDAAVIRCTLHLPANPFGRWLNLRVRLVQTTGLPAIDSIEVGRLPVPVALGEWLGLRLAARAGVLNELQLAAEVVQRVDFRPGAMSLVYVLNKGSAERMMTALLTPAELQRLRLYSDRLARLSFAEVGGTQVSLAALMGPMFELARQRGTADPAAAAAENRAAITVLALYVNGMGVGSVVPAARTWPRARRMQVLLAGRDDWPRHLMVSAALAAEGTGPLSKAIGIYKEVADSRGGSGFSFNDMAANRAGTRLGEMALAQPQKLQALLARGVQEADFMPEAADLPEFMSEAEFRSRYGGVGQPRYVAMMTEIDRRVGALRVLR